MIDIHLIAAARPNFMKIAPLYHALAREAWCRTSVIHTGQHYDANMSGAFFRDLQLPDPDFHLEVGSGTHAQQTGGVMVAYEKIASAHRPDWIIVVGDVNSTAACALVGTKLWIQVVHLEAGLRSRDRRMPEEINRLVTDAISDVLWTPSLDANDNLRAEGIPAERIDCIGNIMLDSFEMLRATIEKDGTRASLGLKDNRYGIVTLHRPSNVDDRSTLAALCDSLRQAALRLPLIFAVHPRTRKQLRTFGLETTLTTGNVTLIEPLGYIQFMNLVCGAAAVITDSGGVQEETTYLGIPCLTLRENTERPITVTEGSNRLVSASTLIGQLDLAVSGNRDKCRRPALWDGHAAQRAVTCLKRRAGVGAG